MWAYRLEGPLTLVRHEIDRPAASSVPEGNVLLRFRAGGICGSDIARCLDGGTAASPGPFGLSLHEIVGEVVETRSDLAVGERVAGWVGQSLGLCEYIVTGAEALTAVEPEMGDIDAAPLQPLACVLYAADRLPDLSGATVAVIGLGPIGLLFAHALKDRGAAHVTGIDLVDRSGVAPDYGLDGCEMTTSRRLAQLDSNRDRFDVVVEAVGHQVGTLEHAIEVVAQGGTILYFGNPDDRHYSIDFGRMMDKGVTLLTGRTPQACRRQAMIRAQTYSRRYPGLLSSYVTHVLPIHEAQAGYLLSSRPAVGRLKVILDAGGSVAP